MNGIFAISGTSGPHKMCLLDRICAIKSLLSAGHVKSAEQALDYLRKEIYNTNGTEEILDLFYGDFKEADE